MKSKLYIRISLFVLALSVSLMLFSYVRVKASRQDDPNNPNNECSGKCEKKAQTEFILWESITRNLLMIKG